MEEEVLDEILVEKKEDQEDDLQGLFELFAGLEYGKQSQIDSLEYECHPLPMLLSVRTGVFRDIEPCLVGAIKEQQPEIGERIGSLKYKFEQDHEEKFEGVYTHLRNQLFADLSDNSSGGDGSDAGGSFDKITLFP